MSDTVRVAIVDDHPLVGGGLAALLTTEDDLEVVGVARETSGAFELRDVGGLRAHRPGPAGRRGL